MSECALCGCPDAGQHAKVAELEANLAEAKREHVALMNVSGALMDSGEVVPEDTCLYGEAVRKITARAEAKLAEAERENKALREQIGGPEREAFNEALMAFDPTQAGRHYLVGAKEMVERASAAEADARALREHVEALEKTLRELEGLLIAYHEPRGRYASVLPQARKIVDAVLDPSKGWAAGKPG